MHPLRLGIGCLNEYLRAPVLALPYCVARPHVLRILNPRNIALYPGGAIRLCCRLVANGDSVTNAKAPRRVYLRRALSFKPSAHSAPPRAHSIRPASFSRRGWHGSRLSFSSGCGERAPHRLPSASITTSCQCLPPGVSLCFMLPHLRRFQNTQFAPFGLPLNDTPHPAICPPLDVKMPRATAQNAIMGRPVGFARFVRPILP